MGGHNAVGGAAFKYAKVYNIEGNIFFGSARYFKGLFEDANDPASPPLIFLDFSQAKASPLKKKKSPFAEFVYARSKQRSSISCH